ncbi:DUF7524 family protein [Halopiger xanaduensis]|uniref:Uncharacterized protein n=1 Tax=Halopiger xanaduensis (strain DSM 18323 / JCM 14033 / SH-6) TaxID=797210 RepID=F8DBP4_HALXS|nr:hypothetical protein [Halopiger xanaduensis]AEH38311.1 hypothetical protein Halxa_3704 [Halopiger xanaduensis SH-6]
MSRTEVTVHVNRESPDTLEAATTTVSTRGSFVLALRGHESPAHVHCRLADADTDASFSRHVSLDQSNYYVEAGETIEVPVGVDAEAIDDPVTGRLEVVTGYGSESVTIDVTVKPKPAAVDVDESLSKPPSRDQSADQTAAEKVLQRLFGASGLDTGTLAVLALGLVALAIATATAATIGGLAAMFGFIVVAGGVVIALALLLW